MDKERVKNVVKLMTLAEKTFLTFANKNGEISGLERLKVPPLQLPYELNPLSPRALNDAVYEPSFFALGHTFDLQLIKDFAALRCDRAVSLGEGYGGTVGLGVIRQPFDESARNGFSEDPLVCAEMARAFIEGSQLKLIGTDILGVNGLNRHIGKRALHEIYLRPFLRVKEALGGVVVPKGRLNNIPVSENREFMAKLVSFDGLIVNEFSDTSDKAEQVSSGASLNIGFSESDYNRLYNTVNNGLLFEKKLDLCAQRTVLAAGESYSLLKTNTFNRTSLSKIESMYLRLALESSVLLKNNCLPLDGRENTAVFSSMKTEESAHFKVEFTPKAQKKLLKAAQKAVGKKTVLVMINGENDCMESAAVFIKELKKHTAVAVCLYARHYVPLPFLNDCDALVYLPYWGAKSWTALKRLLEGKEDFSGKLTASWAESTSCYPAKREGMYAFSDMYCFESVYNGYRYFDAFKSRLMFPFGFGLSYKAPVFRYLKVNESGGEAKAEIGLFNPHGQPVECVFLLFGGFVSDAVYGTMRRLTAFKRIAIDKGGSKDLSIALKSDTFDVYDGEENAFAKAGGKYSFSIGSPLDVAISCESKIGKKIKLKGRTEKELKSYFKTGGDFLPLGVDVEKETGSPLIAGKNAETETAVFKSDKKLLKKYCGKLKDAKLLTQAERILKILSANAKIKLAEKE